jgi:hypothetical protein
MICFKEYYQGDNAMNANAVSAQTGCKSIMRTGRKHENLVRKEYKHKCPHVTNLINGGAGRITLAGPMLDNALQLYGMEFQPGVTNGIGNSQVEIQMFEDEEGQQIGVLNKKPK